MHDTLQDRSTTTSRDQLRDKKPRRPIGRTSQSGVEDPTAVRRAKTPRPSEGRRQLSDTLPSAASLDGLEEITVWLGTFRERLRIAHAKDRKTLEATMKELEAQYRRRRAELS